MIDVQLHTFRDDDACNGNLETPHFQVVIIAYSLHYKGQ